MNSDNDVSEKPGSTHSMSDDSEWPPIPDGYVRRASSTSSVYHTQRDCPLLRDCHKDMRREVAQSWDSLTMCKQCDGSARAETPDHSPQCDVCGGSAAQLTPTASTHRVCVDCRDGGDHPDE